MEKLCKVLSDLKNAGHEVILVSSGAIGMGVGKLSLNGRPKDMPGKQAAAAVGQCELMYTYDKLFHGVQPRRGPDAADRRGRGSRPTGSRTFRTRSYRLLELGALPIINENDTVATAGDRRGRQRHAGRHRGLPAVQADLLVLLSDIDGLYTADPHRTTRMPG